MDNALLQLSSLFRREEIGYYFMRSPDAIEVGGDIDIYVEGGCFDQTIKVLGEEGFHLTATDKMIPFKSVMVKFVEGHYLVLDLHKELVQGGIIYMDGLSVLDRAIDNGHYVVPDDLDMLIILLMHSIIGKGVVQEKHINGVVGLCCRFKNEEIRGRIADPDVWKIIEIVLSELREKYAQGVIAPSLKRNLERILANNEVNKKQRLYRFWVSVNKKLNEFSLKPRAPFYVFMGPDGTGKSTLNHMLEQTINDGGAFRAVIQYMGPWGHYRIKLLEKYRLSRNNISTRQWLDRMKEKSEMKISLLDIGRVVMDQFKKMGNRVIQGTELHNSIREHSKIYLTVRYGYCLFRISVFFTLLFAEMVYRFARVYSYRRKGIAVIGDRYIYDLETGGMHTMNAGFGRFGRAFSKIFPRPTKGYVLMAPAEVILSRKDDLEEGELKQFLELYQQLAC